MRNSTRHPQYLALLLGLGAAGLFAACGGGGSSGGTGGAKATGGTTSTGGTRATGGTSGTTPSGGTSGTTASGGSRASGGATGSGGATTGSGGTTGTTASGGVIGSGGTAAAGGTTGGGGATSPIDGGPGVDAENIDAPLGIDAEGIDDAPVIDVEGIDAPESEAGAGPTVLYDFATGVQGWVFNTWQATDSDSGLPVAPFNLAKDGIQIDGGAMPTIGFDGTVGDPAGSLMVTADFTGYRQQVMPNIGYDPPLDWTGKTVTLRIKVDATLPPELQYSGVSFYAQDTSYQLSKQVVVEFPTDNDWHTLTLPIVADTGGSFDASQISSLVVSIYSNEEATGLDGGAPAVTPTSVTVHIDTVQIQ